MAKEKNPISENDNTVDESKDFFTVYRSNEIELDNQIERLQNLVSKYEGTNSSHISEVPNSGHGDYGKIENYLLLKEEIEADIKSLIDSQREYRSRIEVVLKKLKNPYERAVLRMRYIDVSEWREISAMLFGNREDYEEKMESYTRRMYNLHGSALVNISLIVKNQEEKQMTSEV